MGRYTGPKEKLSRREGVELHLKEIRSFSDKSGLKKESLLLLDNMGIKEGQDCQTMDSN